MNKFVAATPIENTETILKLKEFWKNKFPEISEEKLDEIIAEEKKGKVFINDTYQVIIHEAKVPNGFPDMIWLSIRRLDREPIRDWRHMQAIKNELVGEENEGVELYPAESRLVDSANQYHMWVLKESGIIFPFGMTGSRNVTTEVPEGTNIKQREL